MTICAASTREALRVALRTSPSNAAWARAHGVPPVTVSDCLRRKAMSVRRENTLRVALGLPVIDREQVTISSEERVVRKPGYGPRRSYAERKIRIPPAEAEQIDHALYLLGFDSFSAWWIATGMSRRLISTGLEAAQRAAHEG